MSKRYFGFPSHQRKVSEYKYENESVMSGIDNFSEYEEEEQALIPNWDQAQRRQGIVYKTAQKHAAVLDNLLKEPSSEWSSPVCMSGRGTPRKQCSAPQAYLFKDIYEQKKQRLLQECLASERAQRQFHSRPMPNFNQYHRQQANKQVTPRFTFATTPNVLKASLEMQEKHRQRIEQQLQQREEEQLERQRMRPRANPVPKFSTPPIFSKSQSRQQTRIEFKPFNLTLEKRAEQRKLWNASTQQLQETRRRQNEEKLQLKERELARKQRELATFRARPNPFK